MPLVRYNIGDTGSICEDVCKCGQKSKTLELHGGRTTDYIYSLSGKVISPLAIYLTVVEVNEEFNNIIKRFQARQTRINEIPRICVSRYKNGLNP